MRPAAAFMSATSRMRPLCLSTSNAARERSDRVAAPRHISGMARRDAESFRAISKLRDRAVLQGGNMGRTASSPRRGAVGACAHPGASEPRFLSRGEQASTHWRGEHDDHRRLPPADWEERPIAD